MKKSIPTPKAGGKLPAPPRDGAGKTKGGSCLVDDLGGTPSDDLPSSGSHLLRGAGSDFIKGKAGVILKIRKQEKTFPISPDQFTVAAVESLVKELGEEPPGTLCIAITGLSAWSAPSQHTFWRFVRAVQEQRKVRLKADGVAQGSPLDVALAGVTTSDDPEVVGRQLQAAVIAIATFYPAEARDVCIPALGKRLKGLGIDGFTPSKIAALINSADGACDQHPSSASSGRDPTLLAADFLKRYRQTIAFALPESDARLLLYHAGSYLAWDRVWRGIGPSEVRAMIVKDLQDHSGAGAITARLAGDVELNLQGLSGVGCGSEPLPFYCDAYGPPTKIRRRSLLPLRNGILDLDDLAAGKTPALKPLDPRWFGTTMLPYEYQPDAKCPQFIRFLRQVLERKKDGTARNPGDRRLEVLQEWFGYTLLCDGRFQKFLLMLGEGSNGKGVIQNVWIRMLGQENVSHVSLDQFGERFGLQPLVGKLANICGDLQEIDSVAEGVLKRLTGQDNLTVDRKYEPPLTVAPAVKLIFATNHLPRFRDRSQGVWRRLIAMPFRVVIPDYQQDETLAQELTCELPGVLNWALRGLGRLLDQRMFSSCKVCEEVGAKHRYTCDPIAQFLDEGALLRPANEDCPYRIAKDELYRRYRLWCDEAGFRPLAKNNFGEAISKLPGVFERRPEAGTDGKRPRYWCGIGERYQPPLPELDEAGVDE